MQQHSRRLYRSVFVMVLFFLSSIVRSQSSALQLQLALSPDPSPRISDWQTNKQTATLTLTNLSTQPIAARIEAKVLRNGALAAETDATHMDVITVKPGVSMLSADALFPFSAIKFYKGIDRTVGTTGLLPEGEYQVCVSLIAVTSIAPLTADVCNDFTIATPAPVTLISPADGETVAPSSIPGMAFIWTPSTPSSAPSPQYHLRIVEVLPQQSPYEALTNSRPLIDLPIVDHVPWNLNSSDAGLFHPGNMYAWSVMVNSDMTSSTTQPNWAPAFSFSVAAASPASGTVIGVAPGAGIVATPDSLHTVPPTHVVFLPVCDCLYPTKESHYAAATISVATASGKHLQTDTRKYLPAGIGGFKEYTVLSPGAGYSIGNPLNLSPGIAAGCTGAGCVQRLEGEWNIACTPLCNYHFVPNVSLKGWTTSWTPEVPGTYDVSFHGQMFCNDKLCWDESSSQRFIIYDSTNCCQQNCFKNHGLIFGNANQKVQIDGNTVIITINGKEYRGEFQSSVENQLCNYQQDQVLGELSSVQQQAVNNGNVNEQSKITSYSIAHGWTEEWLRKQSVFTFAAQDVAGGNVQEYSIQLTWDAQTCNYQLTIFSSGEPLVEIQSGMLYNIAQLSHDLAAFAQSNGAYQNNPAWWLNMQQFYFGLLSCMQWLHDNPNDPRFAQMQQQYLAALAQWQSVIQAALNAMQQAPHSDDMGNKITALQNALSDDPNFKNAPGTAGAPFMQLEDTQRPGWK